MHKLTVRLGGVGHTVVVTLQNPSRCNITEDAIAENRFQVHILKYYDHILVEPFAGRRSCCNGWQCQEEQKREWFGHATFTCLSPCEEEIVTCKMPNGKLWDVGTISATRHYCGIQYSTATQCKPIHVFARPGGHSLQVLMLAPRCFNLNCHVRAFLLSRRTIWF